MLGHAVNITTAVQIQHDRQWLGCRRWPIESHTNRRPAVPARNMQLLADKSSDVFSARNSPGEMEHERREPPRVEKARHDPPCGISAAQVFVDHVSGDLHLIFLP